MVHVLGLSPALYSPDTRSSPTRPGCGRQECRSMPQLAPQRATHADPTKSGATGKAASGRDGGRQRGRDPGTPLGPRQRPIRLLMQSAERKCRAREWRRKPGEAGALGPWGRRASTQCSRVRRTGQGADQGFSAVGRRGPRWWHGGDRGLYEMDWAEDPELQGQPQAHPHLTQSSPRTPWSRPRSAQWARTVVPCQHPLPPSRNPSLHPISVCFLPHPPGRDVTPPHPQLLQLVQGPPPAPQPNPARWLWARMPRAQWLLETLSDPS